LNNKVIAKRLKIRTRELQKECTNISYMDVEALPYNPQTGPNNI
jgi:hypothetical protein